MAASWRGAGLIGTLLTLVSACIAPSEARVASQDSADTLQAPRAQADLAAEASAGTHGATAPALVRSEAEWSAATARPTCHPSENPGAATFAASSSTVDWGETPLRASTGTPTANVQPGRVANAAQVVGNLRGGFRTCYQQELGRNRNATGKVELRVSVGCDGSVVAMRATWQGLSRQAVDCMFETAQIAQFDSPDGGSAVIAVPITFVNVDVPGGHAAN